MGADNLLLVTPKAVLI